MFYTTASGGRPSSVNPSSPYRVTGGDVPSGSHIGVSTGIDTTVVSLQNGWETATIEGEFTDNP